MVSPLSGGTMKTGIFGTLFLVMLFGTIVSTSSMWAAENSAPTVYRYDHSELFKGTTAGQKSSAPSVKGTLSFSADKKAIEFLDGKNSSVVSIKYDSVKTMMYEQASKPRYAEAVLISPLFLFAHSKKHYLTIQYTDDAGASQFAIVRLDKSHAREAATAAESQTGKKVEMVAEK
jgi:hypothetical protein